MTAARKTNREPAQFKERELQEMMKTLGQIQAQSDSSSKVRFLRLLAGQAEVYAARIEAHK